MQCERRKQTQNHAGMCARNGEPNPGSAQRDGKIMVAAGTVVCVGLWWQAWQNTEKVRIGTAESRHPAQAWQAGKKNFQKKCRNRRQSV